MTRCHSYSNIVKEKGVFNWAVLDKALDRVASRRRHTVLRFWSVYPGRKSGVPDYIKKMTGYNDAWVYSEAEGTKINYDDWTSQTWRVRVAGG